jgi:hypothetical protein
VIGAAASQLTFGCKTTEDAMAPDDAGIILARLEGFLKAFEWMNHKTNHGCSFDVHKIPKSSDLQTALAVYFDRQSSDFRVEQLSNFEVELRAVFARFLFLFKEPDRGDKNGDYLVDRRQAFSLMRNDGRDGLLEEVGTAVRSLGASSGWRVHASIECEALREWCFQDDVLLELGEELCLFHFGVSD